MWLTNHFGPFSHLSLREYKVGGPQYVFWDPGFGLYLKAGVRDFGGKGDEIRRW